MPNKMLDLSGKTFGKWTVISLGERAKCNQIRWRCQCQCGEERLVRTHSLVGGTSTSCGCSKPEGLMKRMLGAVFTRLTVISLAGKDSRGKQKWNCLCSCGKQVVARTDHLDNCRVLSCGCFSRERIIQQTFKHGLKRTTEYYIWSAMIERCYNPNSNRYSDYGGRGITVCDEWRSDFRKFLAYMGKRPLKHSIDRIDNNGNYEPGNCRWATAKEQGRNTRKTIMISFDGERLPLSDWAERLGIRAAAVHRRMKKGLSAEDALKLTVEKLKQTNLHQSALDHQDQPC
jgi:hypothetical protein